MSSRFSALLRRFTLLCAGLSLSATPLLSACHTTAQPRPKEPLTHPKSAPPDDRRLKPKSEPIPPAPSGPPTAPELPPWSPKQKTDPAPLTPPSPNPTAHQ